MPLSIVNTRQKWSAMYIDFLNLFVASVVGKKYEELCWFRKLSEFVTISDEVLVLLIFENNYDRWINMGKNDDWAVSTVHPKYTTGGNASQTPKKIWKQKMHFIMEVKWIEM